MYPHAASTRLSFLHFLAVLTVLLFGVAKDGVGQRVYADNTQVSSPLVVIIPLSQVTNSNFSIDADTANHSTLSVTLGALGAITAQQNLQFKSAPKPSQSSPVIIKIGTPNSLLNVLGGISVQRTNGGLSLPVAPNYSSSQLLNLLNLLSNSTVGTVIVPSNNEAYDGVRLEVNTTLGGLLEAYYYYAFYITPPQPGSNEIFRCEGETGEVTIANFQNGYTYRLYTAEIGGTEITGTATTTNKMILPSNLDAAPGYWLEAREDDVYPSARVRIDVTEVPVPGNPELSITDVDN